MFIFRDRPPSVRRTGTDGSGKESHELRFASQSELMLDLDSERAGLIGRVVNVRRGVKSESAVVGREYRNFMIRLLTNSAADQLRFDPAGRAVPRYD